MRHLTAGSVVCVVWLLAILQVSCLEDDLCGKGFKYKNGSCYKVTANKPAADSSTSPKDGATEQEGGDGESGKTTVTGLGEVCTDQKQCADKEATYCMIDPSTGEGYCTVKGCTNAAGSCPDDYSCCVLPEPYGALCVDAAGYQKAKSYCAK